MILRNLLLFLSQQKRLRRWVEDSAVAQRLTSKFIAGKTRQEALAVARRLNESGLLVTLDCLGESVENPEEASRSRDEYLQLVEEIARNGLRATVSVKLTHFGLDVSEDLCRAYLRELAGHARHYGTAVEVDMEAHWYVDRTLRLVRELHHDFGCVRAVIQAYLRRSENDIRALSSEKIPVRLCKGAYRAAPGIAFQRRSEIRANFLKLARLLLEEGVHPAFATHDETIIHRLMDWSRQDGRPRQDVEFQMLYGIRETLHGRIRRAGFAVRLYVPYGVAWYPYFMRRLAEHPTNLFFLLKNVFRKPL